MRISREFRFEAAHVLSRHPGKCSREHGHSWRVLVEVWGNESRGTCFVMDYGDLKAMVQPIIDRFDHQSLNFFVRYPSSENLAIHIAHLLRGNVVLGEMHRYRVWVSETENTWCSWDSNNEEDQKIFRLGTLDTYGTEHIPYEELYAGSYLSEHSNMDAEWRSPDLGELTKQLQERYTALRGLTPEEILHQAEEGRKRELSDFIQFGAYVEQYNLYQESLGKPGALQSELAAVLGRKENEG